MALHKSTVCYITGTGGKPYEGASCIVQGFDGGKAKWHVRLITTSQKGKELLVAEAKLRIGYCLLPASVNSLRPFIKLENDKAQGSCGRGLITASPVSAGKVIFEESPLIVAGCLASERTLKAQQHFGFACERWRAFSMLQKSAELEARSDGLYARALAAFADLGVADAVPQHVRLGAEELARTGAILPASASAEERAQHVQWLTNILMRFHSNQFTLANGAAADDTALAASAVFAFTSRINHSCAPSVTMTPKLQYLQRRGVSCSPEQAGGVILCCAQRALAAGDRLTFNYGPKELESWDVHRRRQYLTEKLNFVCGCERCVKEVEECGAPPTEPLEASLLHVVVDITTPGEAWMGAASAALVSLGACVLEPLPTGNQPLVPPAVVNACRHDAWPRLKRLMDLAARYQKQHPHQSPAPAQYQELYTRDPHDPRWDVTVIYSVGGQLTSLLLDAESEATWRALLAAVDKCVKPLLLLTHGFEHGADVEAVGYVHALPGAHTQQWHPDIANQPGLLNVFVPLVDLSHNNGPTEVALGTHVDPATAMRVLRNDGSRQASTPCGVVAHPLLCAGSLLLFDWRTWHRGSENQSDTDRPVAYVTYAARGANAGPAGNSYKANLPSLMAWESALHTASEPAAEGASGRCDTGSTSGSNVTTVAEENAAAGASATAAVDKGVSMSAPRTRQLVVLTALLSGLVACAVAGGIATAKRGQIKS